MTRAILLAGWTLVAGLGVFRIASAQESGQRVHRCAGAHGEIVFSGLPCTAEATAGATAPAAADPSANAACPSSPVELRERVAAAIARKDANALAGLVRWRGVDGTEAGSRLAQLRQLVQRPLLAIDADSGEAQTPDGSLRVRTGSNELDGVRELRFGLRLESGCHWLTW
jgi:hypothetical protein